MYITSKSEWLQQPKTISAFYIENKTLFTVTYYSITTSLHVLLHKL